MLPQLRVREGFSYPIAPSAPVPDLFRWQVEVSVPHDSGWTKNRMWRHARGRTFLSDGARQRRSALAAAIRLRMSAVGAIARQNRVWVALHVSKGHHMGDATNVVDLVLDAVEDATGVDDRWYSLAGVSWDLRPTEPRILVWVGQADLPDVAACRRCGALWEGAEPGVQEGDCPTCRGGRASRPRRPRTAARGAPLVPRPGDPPPW